MKLNYALHSHAGSEYEINTKSIQIPTLGDPTDPESDLQTLIPVYILPCVQQGGGENSSENKPFLLKNELSHPTFFPPFGI